MVASEPLRPSAPRGIFDTRMRALLLLLSGTLAVAACAAEPTASHEGADASREDGATEDARAVDAEFIERDGGDEGRDGAVERDGGLEGDGAVDGGLGTDAGPVLTCWPCEIEPCAPELCTNRTRGGPALWALVFLDIG